MQVLARLQALFFHLVSRMHHLSLFSVDAKKKKKKYLKGSELKAVGIEEKQVYCAIENVVFSCPHSSSSHVNFVLPVVRLGVAAQLVSSPVSFTYVWTASNLEWSIRKILIYY